MFAVTKYPNNIRSFEVGGDYMLSLPAQFSPHPRLCMQNFPKESCRSVLHQRTSTLSDVGSLIVFMLVKGSKLRPMKLHEMPKGSYIWKFA